MLSVVPAGPAGSTIYVLDLADQAAVQRIMPHVAPLLEDPRRPLLMHGAQANDLPLLRRQLGLEPRSVLDTQVGGSHVLYRSGQAELRAVRTTRISMVLACRHTAVLCTAACALTEHAKTC